MADAIARDVMEILDYGEDSVSVAVEEVSARDWADKVFKAEIEGKPDHLYKRPGNGLKGLQIACLVSLYSDGFEESSDAAEGQNGKAQGRKVAKPDSGTPTR